VRPVELTPSLMERLTAIDGTVIIDTHGVCYAIGAILDGTVTVRGDRTRGGRYNSALMYVDSSPFPSLIVVISQDGMVDLVSKPQEITGA
jgi:DisA checkpoint controller-like protein